MKVSNKPIKLMNGLLYYIDEVALCYNKLSEINTEYDHIHELKNGIVLSNAPYNNEIVKFDLNETIDNYGGYCRGFLYPEGKFSGKIKYLVDTQIPDADIRGTYTKSGRSTVIIKGTVQEANGNKDYFWLYLTTKILLNKTISLKKKTTVSEKAIAQVFKLVKRKKSKKNEFELFLNGKKQDTVVTKIKDYMECGKLITAHPTLLLDFPCSEIPKNFIMGIYSNVYIPFSNRIVYITRYDKEIELTYNCGFYSDTFYKMNLNPYRVISEAIKITEHYELTYEKINQEENPGECAIFITYSLGVRGNIKDHYKRGLELINKVFKVAIERVQKEIIKENKARL